MTDPKETIPLLPSGHSETGPETRLLQASSIQVPAELLPVRGPDSTVPAQTDLSATSPRAKTEEIPVLQLELFDYEITEPAIRTEIEEVIKTLQEGDIPFLIKLLLTAGYITNEQYSNIIGYYSLKRRQEPDFNEKDLHPVIGSHHEAKISKTFAERNEFFKYIVKNPDPFIKYLRGIIAHDGSMNWIIVKKNIAIDRPNPLATNSVILDLPPQKKESSVPPGLVPQVMAAFSKNPMMFMKSVQIGQSSFLVAKDGMVLEHPNTLVHNETVRAELEKEVGNFLNQKIDSLVQVMQGLNAETIIEALEVIIVREDKEAILLKHQEKTQTNETELSRFSSFQDLLHNLLESSDSDTLNYQRLAEFLHSNVDAITWKLIVQFIVPRNKW